MDEEVYRSRSVAGEPVAWAALRDDGDIAWIGFTPDGAADGACGRRIVPLYRCDILSGKPGECLQNVTQSEWIPVEERLPADRQRVIAFFPSETESVGEATFRNDEENRWLTEHGSWFEATHWMPLPAPPTDAK